MKKTYQIFKVNNKRNYRRIIGGIRHIDGVNNVNLNKEKEVLYIECNDDIIELDSKILKCLNEYEKSARIEEVIATEVYRKVILLKGLDCGHCAARIESIAKKQLNYERIAVDFSTERFIIETKDKELFNNILNEVEKIAHKVDPKIIVCDMESKKQYHDLDEKPLMPLFQLILFLIGVSIVGTYVTIKSINLGTVKWLFADDLYPFELYEIIILLVAMFLTGYQVILDFIVNIFKRRELDEKFLMTVAAIGAVVTGHNIEAVAVMILYQVGKMLQEKAINHSRKSIKELLSYEVTSARLKVDDEELEVEVESVLPGDILIIKTGEMIPIDGVIVEGKTFLDSKALTGESIYQNVKVGDSVRSGAINMGNVIEVKAKKIYRDSTMSQILDMVENASAAKAKTENFITKFAKVYTPVVVVIAMIVSFLLPFAFALFEGDISLTWKYMLGDGESRGFIYTGMVFLVIACPCALVISIPLAFFGGIGLASKRGILVKGSNYLEALSNTEYILFDKTGTLTKGDFAVQEIVSVDPNFKVEELHKLMAYAEYHSTHPIGISIVESYGKDLIFPEIIDDYVHLPGYGVRAYINGARIAVVNSKMLDENKIEYQKIENPNLVLYILREKRMIGYVIIGDTIREDASETIKNLRKQGIKKVSILTGDNKLVSESVGKTLSVDNIYAELFPQDKVKVLEEHKNAVSEGKKVVFVGDGINDAPVISGADVGIAMSVTASEGSIAIADVVVMNDKLKKINEAIEISKITKKIVIQNTVMSLAIKFAVFIVNILNVHTTIWLAIFSDVGVSLLAILNALRINRIFYKRYLGAKKDE